MAITTPPISSKQNAHAYQQQDMVRMTVLAVAYSAIAVLVSSLFLDPNKIGLLWPCSGLALVILLKFGIRYLPVIFIGELAGNLYAGFDALNAVVLALFICTEPIAGFWMLRHRLQFDAALQKPKDYFLLGIAAVLSASISAFLGSIYLHFQGELVNQTLVSSMLHWWQGDLLGIVLIAPLILVWQKPPAGWLSPARRVETILFFALAFLAGQIVFLDWFSLAFSHLARSFWMFLFLAWAAIRYGRHGALIVIVLVSIQALYGTLEGIGTFASDKNLSGLLGLQNLWLYIITITVVGMALALTIESLQVTQRELQESERELRASRNTLEKLFQQLVQVREDERKHLAREVHDELGQILTAIKVEATTLIRKSTESPSAKPLIERLRDLADQSIKMTRSITSNLRPAVLDIGLIPAITWLTENCERNLKLHCALKIKTPLVEEIQDPLKTAVFRIVQESLTNIIRHAHATEANVSIGVEDGFLTVKVSDDGCGFDLDVVQANYQGMGLAGMEERAKAVGGELIISSTLDAGGTTIVCVIPLESEEGNQP